jgi:hypothetical protein
MKKYLFLLTLASLVISSAAPVWADWVQDGGSLNVNTGGASGIRVG